MLKRTPLRRKSKSPVAKAKQEVQRLVRDIVIIRDGGCILYASPELGKCGGYARDGHLILQADHLVSRGKNVGFADTRLVVCVCMSHHASKTFALKKQIEEKYRELIGEERSRLWTRAENDRGDYHMGLHEWNKKIIALQYELNNLK